MCPDTSEGQQKPRGLAKASTGIKGLDEITFGGLPKGRPTLVCGSAGCGKTLLGMQFLVRGAQLGEPGVCVTFEERVGDLIANVASLGFDLNQLIDEKKLVLDYVFIERSEIEETGEYDLEGLFVRLDLAIELIGAKRVALDTIEVLFSKLEDERILRSELSRLFRWLKEPQVSQLLDGDALRLSTANHSLPAPAPISSSSRGGAGPNCCRDPNRIASWCATAGRSNASCPTMPNSTN